MEKLKPSEEEIIKLGKKIVDELQLEPSVNTLGRWMSHYVAELILQVENEKDESDKRAKQKECCEVILKLWKNREHLPNISTPLSGLKPLIDLLEVLIEKEHPLPYFRGFSKMSNEGSWTEMVNTVKSNSKNIFRLCLLSQVNSEFLNKKQKWLKEHKSMLTKDEEGMLERLEHFVNRSKSFIIFSDEKEEEIIFDELSPQKRYEAIFDKIESELDEQKEKLSMLRKSIITSEEE